jgi:hypothetical protein
MTAPWQENQQKVVVEFLKGNQGANTSSSSRSCVSWELKVTPVPSTVEHCLADEHSI